ncbi:Heparinase II/III family protein [Exiguobacterium sp. 8H]|uniref:heparinase II/III family protein n=1 Tax=unclassified Exiguobacterium TaxID=2644629 RepID=UPI0012F26A66|nr:MULTISPECIES: heparinase II/III family protein [unclassified Exiguobacterium]VXB55788.1 Heparinase II/III family protein [Exiguobacterium sp. 8A]VXB56748.1 Heparinase II/III family protein [Exiguobacterium sp. 8H]
MKPLYRRLSIGMLSGMLLFAPMTTASANSDFNVRVAPSTTLHQMKGKKLVPLQKTNTTKEYRIVRPSGWYYLAMSGGKRIYIKKSQAEVVPARSLTKARIQSKTNRPLVHTYMGQTESHIPYEYDRLSTEQAKQFADRALAGNWYIPTKPNNLSVPNIDTFNWHKDVPAVDSNSFPFQLHYLTVLNQLTQAYNDTGDLAYLKYGERLIKSWTKAHPAYNYKRLKWGYNDQGTAIRVFHLLNFWDVYKETSLYRDPAFTELMLKTLYEHGEILASSDFYKPKHNHGIFQDIALTAIAQTFPEFDRSKAWQSTASTRLQAQIAHSISPEGVHLEHSPRYHVYVYHTLSRFIEWAEANQFVLPSRSGYIEKMPDQLTYMLKPNRTLPIFGDTTGHLQGMNIIPKTNEYPELSFAVSGGAEGVAPTLLTKQIGDQYSFMREYWSRPPEAFSGATQVMMTAGYHSSAHKHADDLSIDFYGLARDFIIETGRFGYSSRPERKEVFKVEAHNTIHRYGENLDLSKGMIGRSRIVKTEDRGETSLAIGESALIGKGATHRRTLVYDKAKTLVVYDRITSPKPDMFVQRFHLGEGLKLYKGTTEAQNVTFRDSRRRSIQLMQLETDEESYMSVQPSHLSVRDAEWTLRDQVVSIEYGTDVRYITLMRIDRTNTSIVDTTVKEQANQYELTYTLSNGETHTLDVPK